MTKEEAITIMSDIRSEYNCFSHIEGGRYHALSMGIDALKEQKHGKWIVSAYELPVGTHCDNCGWAWVDHIDAVKLEPIFSHIKTNYCPNCGADMRQKGGDS